MSQESLTGQQYDIQLDDNIKAIYPTANNTTNMNNTTANNTTASNTYNQTTSKNVNTNNITSTTNIATANSTSLSDRLKANKLHIKPTMKSIYNKQNNNNNNNNNNSATNTNTTMKLNQPDTTTNTTTNVNNNNNTLKTQSITESTTNMRTHPFYEIFAIFNENKYILNLQRHSSLQPLLVPNSNNNNNNNNNDISYLNSLVSESINEHEFENQNINNNMNSNSSSIDTFHLSGKLQVSSNNQQTQTVYTQPISFDFHNKCYWSEFQLNNTELLKHPGTTLYMNSHTHSHFNNTSAVTSKNTNNNATNNVNTNIDKNDTANTANRDLNAMITNMNAINTTMTVIDHEILLETQIKDMITQWRYSEYNLNTQYDNKLSYALQPALLSYETERCLGYISQSNEQDFQSMIKYCIRKN